MDNEKIGLFKTIIDTYNNGGVSLSPSDKAKIENETVDLIRKSQMNRKASMTPELETKMEEKLDGISDPKQILTVVIDALKEEGIIESEEPEESEESNIDTRIKNIEKKLDKLVEEEEEEEESSDKSKPLVEDEEGEDEESEDDMELKRAQALDMAKKLDKECPFSPGKGIGKGKDKKKDIKDLQNKKDDEIVEDSDNMGIEEESKFMTSARKFRAGINSVKDVVLFHEDNGPLAYIKVPKDIKASADELRRYAHRICATMVYDGVDAVKNNFMARIITKNAAGIGGSDDNVITTGGDVSPASDAVTDNVDISTKEDPNKLPNDSLEKADFDSKEKQDKVTARVARYEVLNRKAKDTVLDNVDFTSEKPNVIENVQTKSVSDGADDLAEEDMKKPEDSALNNADDDISSVEARFQKIYKSRAEKEANERVASFVDKFTKCFGLAAQRMVLNHEYHPLKAAALDVLVSDDISFANGDRYHPMDKRTATELIELIFSEGQSEFVDKVLDRTASLMKKSDEYIDDASEDMVSLSPVSVVSEDIMDVSDKIDEKSSKLRREVKRGNFEFNRVSATNSVKKISGREQLRSALAGSTRLGRTFSID